MTDTQQQDGLRMARNRLEDFAGLFDGQCGIAMKKMRRVRQRRVQIACGFDRGGHAALFARITCCSGAQPSNASSFLAAKPGLPERSDAARPVADWIE